ncbi:MAG: hypothetical protein IJS32_07155, partial [Kiritimatiellae bacterium]|nr:hypothetical protein [Kiritimatiellia bacterium]
PAVAPMPSPFHRNEAKSITQLLALGRLPDAPGSTPRATRHAIRFADALPDATRPQGGPAAAPGTPAVPAPRPPAAPVPPPAPNAPETAPIRFSDIIQ